MLTLATAWCTASVFSIYDKDRQAYRELVAATSAPSQKESSPEKSAFEKSPQEKSSLVQQKRTNIRKDIFYLQGTARLALSLTAAHSTLELDEKDSEIIEKLNQVTGYMQEELYYLLPDGREAFLQDNGRLLLRNGNSRNDQDYVVFPLSSLVPMQSMRYFEADHATYFYKSNHLLTQQVKVSRYVIPGHSLATSVEGIKPVFTGMAQSAEIALADTQFKANQIKATYFQEAPAEFEARDAAYDGKSLTMSGNVVLEHPVGTLAANQAILTGVSEGRKISVHHLDLYDQVNLSLSEGGDLICAEAHLSQQTSRGDFSGSPAQPFVVYMEQCRDSSGSQQRLPVIVKSRTMAVDFEQDAGFSSPKRGIKTIVANEQVTVDYNHDFIAAADRATFHREEGADDQAKTGLTGVICLQANVEEGHCHVTNRNGDLIHARQIFVNTRDRFLSFVHPKGALYTIRTGYSKERIDFSSDTLNWDEKLGTLNLLGHVMIAQKGLGKLTSDEQVTLNHAAVNGRKLLSTIESQGHTILTHQEEGRGQDCSHVLESWGKMFVDHANLKIALESPEKAKDKQVFYQDRHGSLYSDRAFVAYHWIDGALKPGKIVLEGNVKMVNKPVQVMRHQFALADRVEIFPETQEALLSAADGRRVLVYDQVNDMQASATGIKLKRDQITKKESLQGIGDVRFNLIDPELEQLYKRFEQIQKPFSKKET